MHIIISLIAIIIALISVILFLCFLVRFRSGPSGSSELTDTEVVQYKNILLERNFLKDREVLVEYWKKVKETIHLFDDIIVKYAIQWSAFLLAIVGASTIVYQGTTQELNSGFLAGIISLTAMLISIPIAFKCWFYYELLEEALRVAKDIERIMFLNENDNLANRVGLTLRLTSISTKPRLKIGTYFGWTIFLPFAFLFIISLGLMLFYFNEAMTNALMLLWV